MPRGDSNGNWIGYRGEGHRVVGAQEHRQELDIFGSVIIRASRLEAHTKVVGKNFDPLASLVLTSPDFAVLAENFQAWQRLETAAAPLRDFPDVKAIWAKPFVPHPENSAKARLVA